MYKKLLKFTDMNKLNQINQKPRLIIPHPVLETKSNMKYKGREFIVYSYLASFCAKLLRIFSIKSYT